MCWRKAEDRERWRARLVGMDLLINIDVPDLAEAIAFYTQAFGLTVTRRLGVEVAELSGLPARIYLLQKPGGSIGAAKDPRRFDRHWTPVHIRPIEASKTAVCYVRNTSSPAILGRAPFAGQESAQLRRPRSRSATSATRRTGIPGWAAV
jgi:catechol 2,3-dioxygenase-like lactoylglutathione lyase family enzyme